MFVSLSACALLHIVMSPLCFIIAHFNTKKNSSEIWNRLNYIGCDSLSKWNALHQFWNITDCPFSLFFIERKVLNLKCFNNEEDVTPFLTSCGVLLAHPSQKVHFVKKSGLHQSLSFKNLLFYILNVFNICSYKRVINVKNLRRPT